MTTKEEEAERLNLELVGINWLDENNITWLWISSKGTFQKWVAMPGATRKRIIIRKELEPVEQPIEEVEKPEEQSKVEPEVIKSKRGRPKRK